MKKLSYKTSKDYNILKRLLDTGKEVVCFSEKTYSDGEKYYDCNLAKKLYEGTKGKGVYHFGDLDLQDWFLEENNFESCMEKYKIEFIEPTL
jgi:hypothetical protein